jgi:hypothetical protein
MACSMKRWASMLISIFLRCVFRVFVMGTAAETSSRTLNGDALL